MDSSAPTTTQVFAISICKFVKGETEHPIFLSSAFDLSSFGFFQKGNAKEFIKFFSRTFIERTPVGKRQSVEHEGYNVHCYLRSDGLGCVTVTVREYNSRIVYTMMTQLLDKFYIKFRSDIETLQVDAALPFEEINTAIVKYQNPAEADKISKIQKDLDETMEIVQKTIDTVIDRGDKLDSLVKQSADLSASSQMFYNTAASQNKCCIIS